MLNRRRTLLWMLVAVAAIAVIAVPVIRTIRAGKLTPAEQTVQSVLELRSKNATDAALYEGYVESTSVAAALAEDSIARKAGESPIPKWDRPRVSKETSAATEVLVKWRPSSTFKDWPESTVFLVALRKGRWVLIDAEESRESTSAEATKAPAPK